ncbi:patatin-like phospholipase family protein [Chitinophaga japonensis]|uniref:NTE family protein n=1 Tax=Chitinophaga japonensis TaxID=104662 RepID=A0A562SSD6_CHIJA|nr:patatin-like phospholipase family protein [Chitinophaga japonensis]TWI84155.1 NTE family protein [Chitinophaga japonensis]
MKRYSTILLAFLLLGICFYPAGIFAQSGGERPKIGLTLSGGGAKGLAHIGILQAIDSAGLKIDYVTGTSMGSIVGALYAMGYSGDTIEVLADQLDWDNLFANQPALTEISYEEKSEYNKYIVEIPFEYGKPKLASGVITGEQLWLELARLCWPVKDVRDFSDFSIPFKCIATDVATGDIVTLDTGYIVSCLRASMAIPSIFTAVKIGDRKLVDGGVVRNFPVITAKEMGADIVIGSNVSGGLRKADELVTPIDILYQLGFYKDAVDFREARKLCDIYIQHELEDYSAASFGSVDSIIELGKVRGREMYPVFKKLADSLNALYPAAPPFVKDRLPFTPDVELTSINIDGLVHSDEKFFRGRLNLQTDGCYNAEQLREAVRNVFGTRFYKQITYELIPEGPAKSSMHIEAEENPLTYVKFALHYNTFTNASAIVNLTQRNFAVRNSRSSVTAAISENPRLRGEYFKYLGRKRNFGFGMGVYYENNGLNIYENFKRQQQYRSKYAHAEIHMQYMLNLTMAIGVGTRWEYFNYRPSFAATEEIRGNSNQMNNYVYYGVNSLDRKIYPRKGMDLQFEAGWVYNQHPGYRAYRDGHEVPLDTLGLAFGNYQHAMLQMKYHLPAGPASALQLGIAGGINYNYNQPLSNGYILGGLNTVAHHQLQFPGIYEGEVITSSAAIVQLGYQREVMRNVFLVPRVGVALYDFNGDVQGRYKYLSGYALTAGYSSRLGPIEGSLMYCDQDGRLRAYVNIGFSF